MKKKYVCPESFVVELQNEGALMTASSEFVPINPNTPAAPTAPAKRNAWDDYENN